MGGRELYTILTWRPGCTSHTGFTAFTSLARVSHMASAKCVVVVVVVWVSNFTLKEKRSGNIWVNSSSGRHSQEMGARICTQAGYLQS